MDAGLLVLRLLLATVLFAHAMQKSLGWFRGNGLAKQAQVFESFGLKPGRVMVALAAACELTAAALLALGLLTPLGGLIAAGTMAVAGITMHLAAAQIWNVAGGGEYPYVLAALAVVLVLTGPGRYSLDAALAGALFEAATAPPVWVGGAVAGIAVLAGLGFATLIRRNTTRS